MPIASEMVPYIGTKAVRAVPMTLDAYELYRGDGFKVDTHYDDPLTAGYLVEYDNTSKPNHTSHIGYISWSPKSVFEAAYCPIFDTVGYSWSAAIRLITKFPNEFIMFHTDMGELEHIKASASLNNGAVRFIHAKGVHWEYYLDIPLSDLARVDWTVKNRKHL